MIQESTSNNLISNSLPERFSNSLPERAAAEWIGRCGGRKFLVGYSGGADSTALLLAFSRMRAKENLTVEAIHCNFNLRGKESLRDRDFAIDICRKLGVRLHVMEFDVEAYININGGSVEMACRELRYAEFHRLRKEHGFDRIVVAHNADDNVETMLLNLFRGSGISGLAAMQPDNNHILRPFLGTTRKEIEAYLEENGIPFITDSSNLENTYRRNFIRNQLLPMVESRWPGVRTALYRSVDILGEERKTLRTLESKLLDPTPGQLPYPVIEQSPDQSWIIHRFALRHGASNIIAGEISASYTGGPERFRGKKWETSTGTLIFSHDALVFLEKKVECKSSFKEERLKNSDELMDQIRSSRDNGILWLPFPLSECTVRKPRPGDRLRPLGMNGSKLVSDIIKDAKTDPAVKRNLSVVESKEDGEILWVENLRRSRLHLVSPTDTHVYRISRLQ